MLPGYLLIISKGKGSYLLFVYLNDIFLIKFVLSKNYMLEVTKKNIYAILPARLNSKRIIKKNIKLFRNQPMISIPIKVAKESKLFREVFVSTDSEDIAKISSYSGASVPFLRSPEISDDYTPVGKVISEFTKWLIENDYKPDIICTIYPCSPLIKIKRLKEAYQKFTNSDAKCVFSCSEYPHPIQRAFKKNLDGRVEMIDPKNFLRRSQDLEKTYHDAGQFYFMDVNFAIENKVVFCKDSIPFVLPREEVIDIDTLEDWKLAENQYKII